MKGIILFGSMLLFLFTACGSSDNNSRVDLEENSAISTNGGSGTNSEADGDSLADADSDDERNTDTHNGDIITDTDTSIFYAGHVEPAKVLQGAGYNIDSTAFWTAPVLEESLILITAKGNKIVEIWQYPFEIELEPLSTSTEVNGIAVDQSADLLYLALPGSQEVKVYSLPDLTPISSFGKGIIGFGENNLALYHPESGSTTIYVSDDHNVYFFDETYALLGKFAPSEISSIETLVADNFHEIIYIPEEHGIRGNEGVYAFFPDGTPFEKNGTNRFGAGHFEGDEEGIVLYCRLDENGNDTGSGYIIVADQMRSISEFEFFDRETWAHAGVLTVGSVKNTDGIASSQVSYPDYPMGIFAAVDNDSRTAIVGWDVIFKAGSLSPF
jgi:hypothetical protein